MARVRDLWFSEVPARDADGNPLKGDDGRAVMEKRKSARHPDRDGNRNAKRWLAVWLDPDGREKTKAFATTAPALAYARKMEADAERGEYVDPKAGRALFGDVALRYIRLRKIGGGSRQRYESVYRNHVRPVFGARPVAAVRASEIAEWLQGPAAELSSGVQATAFLTIAGAFDLAVADKMRRDNPARSGILEAPRYERGEREVWTAGTVWAVRDELPEPCRPLLDCLAGLGLRRGCAFALAEDDFDFDAGKVRVRRQVIRVGREIVFKLPKGGRERVVPLPLGVAASVRAHMERHPPAAVTLPWMKEKPGGFAGPVTARLVFTWDERPGRHVAGRCLQNGDFYRDVWRPALSAAGILPPPEVGERGRLTYRVGDETRNGMHAPRHVYQSMLDDGGVSLAGRVEFMGHSRKSQGITVGVYGHVTEETFERARNAVDQRLFKLRPVPASGTVTEFRRAQ